jgi:localization factor PodJL
MAAMPGQNIEMPVTVAPGKTVSQLSLPPATVGPLSLRLAAANGDPSAAFEVGARLAEGKGTSQNFQEAMTWYQKSAAQGFAQAQYRLGTLYERGLGTKADLARAQMWYQRAAEQGNVKAMHNLAVLSAGRSAGSPDYMTAARWFEGAADYGLSDSQYNLAVLFENGLGVAKDPVQAFKWYALAGRGGDAEATRRRDALKSQLTADQRLRGEEAVANFNPKRTALLINDARAAGEDWKKRQDG